MVEQFRHDEPDFEIPEDETEEKDEEATPSILPVLPLRGTVVFPLTLVPLAAGQPTYRVCQAARSIKMRTNGLMSLKSMVPSQFRSPAYGAGVTR